MPQFVCDPSSPSVRNPGTLVPAPDDPGAPPRRSRWHLIGGAAIVLALTMGPLAGLAGAQPAPANAAAPQIIVPSARSTAFTHQRDPVRVEQVDLHVSISGRTARTSMTLTLRNPSSRMAEGIVVLPVPGGAAITRLVLGGGQSGFEGELLPREEARRIYDGIVRRLMDPALLEFVGDGMIRTSVFPIEPRGTHSVQLEYEEILQGDGSRIDYVLPRTDSVATEAPWSVYVDVRAAHPIASVYCPSHPLQIKPVNPQRHQWIARNPEAVPLAPGPLRISVLSAEGALPASVFVYPDSDHDLDGGWFLLIAAPPAAETALSRTLRDITVVIDRSGSMSGGKLDQVRAAALQVIEGLAPGEWFNVIDYATGVNAFADRSVQVSPESIALVREYLKRLRPGGGTNISGALRRSLEPDPPAKSLSIVLFLTDGLPTVGERSERGVLAIAENENPHQRRIFSFGVGFDVNAPLLDGIAERGRGTSTYVAPQDDVEVAVESVARRLHGPVLTDVTMRVLGAPMEAGRVHDVVPLTLPDLFQGDQLTLLGRYSGTEPIRLGISGTQGGKVSPAFEVTIDPSRAAPGNAFVARLWAVRQIAYLIDEVRALGAESPRPNDLRMRELTDEIVRLSLKHGVLTEYTAFLATEEGVAATPVAARREVEEQLRNRAVGNRRGGGGVAQAMNMNAGKYADGLHEVGTWVDAEMRTVRVTRLRQIADVPMIPTPRGWTDGRILARGGALPAPDETIDFGTPAYDALMDRLVAEGRGGVLSQRGELLLLDGARVLLVRNVGATEIR